MLESVIVFVFYLFMFQDPTIRCNEPEGLCRYDLYWSESELDLRCTIMCFANFTFFILYLVSILHKFGFICVRADCVRNGFLCKGCAKVLLEFWQEKNPFRNLLGNGILSKQSICKLLGMHMHSNTFKLALF